jgi:hypothetical protein
MEEGTRVEMTAAQRQEFLANLRRHGSKRQVYLYLGMACNMFGLLLLESRHLQDKPAPHYFFIFLSVFFVILCLQAWRSRPRKNRNLG